MGPDANWLDILKANGWQFGCLAAGAWLAVIGDKYGWLPVALDPVFQQGVMLAGVALSALWVAAIGSTASKWVAAPVEKMKRKRAIQAHAQEFREYIPYMTPEERAIFAQLIHENHKSFTCDADGGKAATLIARGYVAFLKARGGQYVSADDVPFGIPDHIWKVATERKADFPFKPDPEGTDAWRVHWMAR